MNNKMKATIAENISTNIQFLMKENNLSAEEFAEKTDLNCHRIKSMINKTAKRLWVSDILKIISAFQVSFDWFVGREKKDEYHPLY